MSVDQWSPYEVAERERGAVISPCERYRYRLWRHWGDGSEAPAVFLMLNPSTADAAVDDPTIRKCIGFAKRWGQHGIRVVNLFAYRATNPVELGELSMLVAVGQDNGEHLSHVLAGDPCGGRQLIVCAWGSTGGAKVKRLIRERLVVVRRLFREIGAQPMCLGMAADGSPRHPLMLSYDTALMPWEVRS